LDINNNKPMSIVYFSQHHISFFVDIQLSTLHACNVTSRPTSNDIMNAASVLVYFYSVALRKYKRRMEVIVLQGRAGRTQEGVCYRLYTLEDFEKMRHDSVPEILRVHVGQALLKLMSLGVPDPANFDFVQVEYISSKLSNTSINLYFVQEFFT